MKKVLVIGANGFVGPYLCNNLIEHGYDVFGTKLITEETHFNGKCFDIDILNKDNIEQVINRINPDYIVHLAALSSVKLSWDKPDLTFQINVIGIINIFEVLRKLNLRPRILLVGSSEEYGEIKKPIVNETYNVNPLNFYALSKVTQEKIGKIYKDNYGFDVVFARSFNHIGPGQSTQFVVSDFANQIAQIEKDNTLNEIHVGNIKAKRDFSDVRDIVNAYRLLLEKGKNGEIYNVGSGKCISIEEILNYLISFSNKKINIVIDENKFRPIDTPEIKADISKLVKDTGYSNQFDIKQTLFNVLEYFRNKNYEK